MLSMYQRLFVLALCVCLLPCLSKSQAVGAVHKDVDGVDVPAEPVLIEKEEMEKEMEEHENQRKLEEEDEFEVIDHEQDEEKRVAKKVDGMKVQV